MKVLRKERFYPFAPEVVWLALTDPAALAEWLMPNNFAPALGAKFEFRTDATPVCGSGLTRCEVLEFDPPRRMTWSWCRDAAPGAPAHPPMRIAWTLTTENEGTRLRLEQTGLEGQGWIIGVLMSIGWGMMMRNNIPRVLRNISHRTGALAFDPGAIPLGKRYYRAKSVPAEFLHGDVESVKA